MQEEYDTDLSWTGILLEDEAKWYLGVYVALMVLALSKFVLFEMDLAYWTLFAAIMVLAAVKTGLIVAYYQHLRWEPRILSYLMLTALAAVLLLMVAAAYSIT